MDNVGFKAVMHKTILKTQFLMQRLVQVSIYISNLSRKIAIQIVHRDCVFKIIWGGKMAHYYMKHYCQR